MHCRDLTGDSSESKTAVDILIKHLLADEPCRRKRCAAAAHLHGEAVIEIAGCVDNICCCLCNEKLLGILGVTGRAGHNAFRVANIIG